MRTSSTNSLEGVRAAEVADQAIAVGELERRVLDSSGERVFGLRAPAQRAHQAAAPPEAPSR
jgi:hypothetical protein